MKKALLILMAVSLAGLFFYFNRDLFLSEVALPRTQPEYIEVVIVAGDKGEALSWKVDSPEKALLITDMLFQGVELHGHKHEPFGSIKVVYPDKEAFMIDLYQGHVEGSFEFSHKSKTYVIDSVTFLTALKSAGVDVSLIAQYE